MNWNELQMVKQNPNYEDNRSLVGNVHGEIGSDTVVMNHKLNPINWIVFICFYTRVYVSIDNSMQYEWGITRGILLFSAGDSKLFSH